MPVLTNGAQPCEASRPPASRAATTSPCTRHKSPYRSHTPRDTSRSNQSCDTSINIERRQQITLHRETITRPNQRHAQQREPPERDEQCREHFTRERRTTRLENHRHR